MDYTIFCPENGAWYAKRDNDDGSITLLQYRSLFGLTLTADEFSHQIASGRFILPS